MFVKVCGLTRTDDARQAVDAGATALGFIFVPDSPRHVTAESVRAIVDALPPGTMTYGVFQDATPAEIRDAVQRSGVSGVQLHGKEPASYAGAIDRPLMKAAGLDELAALGWPPSVTLLLDAVSGDRRGGSGRQVDWERAAAVARERRVVLAGGLTPDNVAEAIATVRPHGVDVSSGVERSPGVKDHEKVALFIARARRAFELAHVGSHADRDHD